MGEDTTDALTHALTLFGNGYSINGACDATGVHYSRIENALRSRALPDGVIKALGFIVTAREANGMGLPQVVAQDLEKAMHALAEHLSQPQNTGERSGE